MMFYYSNVSYIMHVSNTANKYIASYTILLVFLHACTPVILNLFSCKKCLLDSYHFAYGRAVMVLFLRLEGSYSLKMHGFGF